MSVTLKLPGTRFNSSISYSFFCSIPFVTGDLRKARDYPHSRKGLVVLDLGVLGIHSRKVGEVILAKGSKPRCEEMQNRRVILGAVHWKGVIGLEKWASDNEGP